MRIIGGITNRRRRDGGHLAPLLGLPAVVITIAALTMAPANAATGPGDKPTLPASAVTAAPRHATPAIQPAPRKPARPAGAADSCLLFLNDLTASAYTVPVGTTVWLNTSTTCNLTNTPYYLEIFDATTKALVYQSGFLGPNFPQQGVTQTVAGTHGYVAVLDAPFSTVSPPLNGASPSTWGITATVYVTWEAPPNNFQVSLSGPSWTPPGTPGHYVATVNQDVTFTPYYIEIFDETTSTRLAVCPSGTSCPVDFLPSTSGDYLVAFVSANSTALPPPASQANSAVLRTVQGVILP